MVIMNASPTAPETRPLMLPLPETIIAGRDPSRNADFIRAYREAVPGVPAFQRIINGEAVVVEELSPAECSIQLQPAVAFVPRRLIVSDTLLLGSPSEEAIREVAKGLIIRSITPARFPEPQPLWYFHYRAQPDLTVFSIEIEPDGSCIRVTLELENQNDGPVLIRGMFLGRPG